MEHYIKNINNKGYLSFFKYFKKVWTQTNFVKFDKLNIDEFSKRTNNVCEWFHKKLNDTIDGYHQKIAYLVEKLKDFSIDSYNKYKIEKSSFKNELISGINLSDDIFNFLKKYKKKYKSIPNFKNILQLKEEEENSINEILSSIMNLLYNLDLEEKNDDENSE